MQTVKSYRYILDPSSKKYKCPNCGQFSLVIFIDSETGEIMESYGRCDRESKCGFFYHPSKDGFQNNKTSMIVENSFFETVPTFHKNNLVELSMNYDNNLLKYLRLRFGDSIANSIKKKYKIGTLPEFNYGTVFWQIDDRNKVRGGKVIQYFETGKRTKKITWMHQFLMKKNEISDFNLSQCLFGLHLTKDDKASVIALVESEKTACIMSVIFPEFLWLSCGAKGEFKLKKLEPNLSDEAIGALYAPTAGIVSPYELTIAAADHSVLRIDQLQPAGKSVMSSQAYLNGAGSQLTSGDLWAEEPIHE